MDWSVMNWWRWAIAFAAIVIGVSVEEKWGMPAAFALVCVLVIVGPARSRT